MKSKVITTGILILVGLMIFIGPMAENAQADAIKWYSYDEGMSVGKIENKKIFLHFFSERCRYCKQMDNETFKSEPVISYLNRHFIPIRVNSDKNQELSAKYKVLGLPDSWFLADNGEVIGNRTGYIDPKMLMKIFEYVKSASVN